MLSIKLPTTYRLKLTRADKDLAERAWRRFKASDAVLGENAVAWAVTTTMKAESKMGGGKRKKKNSGNGLYLKPYKKTGQGGNAKKSSKKEVFYLYYRYLQA